MQLLEDDDLLNDPDYLEEKAKMKEADQNDITNGAET